MLLFRGVPFECLADLFKAQDMTWNHPRLEVVFAAEKGNSEIAWFTGNHCEPDPVSVNVWRPVWIIHNNHVKKIWLNKKSNRPCWEGGVTSFYHQLEWGSGLGERLKGWKACLKPTANASKNDGFQQESPFPEVYFQGQTRCLFQGGYEHFAHIIRLLGSWPFIVPEMNSWRRVEIADIAINMCMISPWRLGGLIL